MSIKISNTPVDDVRIKIWWDFKTSKAKAEWLEENKRPMEWSNFSWSALPESAKSNIKSKAKYPSIKFKK